MAQDDPRSVIRKSQDTLYTGVAAETLAKDSITLLVICPELLPQSAFGGLGPGISNNNTRLQDRDGNVLLSKNTTANHIVATWEGESNRRYPPMVEKGEPVEIYRQGDSDKFFWRAPKRGRDFRKTDRIHIEVAAGNPDKKTEAKTDNNTYSAYLDPVDKKVGFKTSKANGEACAMVMEADLGKGTIYLSDDSSEPGNRLVLDTGITSGKPSFHLNLSTGITLRMEGDDLLVKVPGKFLLQADDRIVIDSPLTIVNRASVGTIIVNAGTVSFNTAKDFVVKAGGVVGVNAITVKIMGVLAAATAKITSLVKLPVTGEYKTLTMNNPEEQGVPQVNNESDTNMTGLPYRT